MCQTTVDRKQSRGCHAVVAAAEDDESVIVDGYCTDPIYEQHKGTDIDDIG